MPAMMIGDSREAFLRYCAQHGCDLTELDAAKAVTVMLDWYEVERADDAASLDQDGDGLLFQWGAWDFDAPATFQYNLTRQFLHDCDEGCLRQLSLTLHYAPEPESDALASEPPVWCFGTKDVPALRSAISTSAATAHVARRRPVRVTLDLEAPC
jgi:hypothetical protein